MIKNTLQKVGNKIASRMEEARARQSINTIERPFCCQKEEHNMFSPNLRYLKQDEQKIVDKAIRAIKDNK